MKRTLYHRMDPMPDLGALSPRQRAVMEQWKDPNWLWCSAQLQAWYGISKRRGTAVFRALEKRGYVYQWSPRKTS